MCPCETWLVDFSSASSNSFLPVAFSYRAPVSAAAIVSNLTQFWLLRNLICSAIEQKGTGANGVSLLPHPLKQTFTNIYNCSFSFELPDAEVRIS